MRLVRFSVDNRPAELGVSDGRGVASLASRVSGCPPDMISLIERWSEFESQVRAIDSFDHPLKNVHLYAPIPRPGKILGIGLNYADHAAEGSLALPTDQMWFSKPSTAVNGPFDPIDRPIVSEMLDYEAELVFVIGKRCRHVSPKEAGKMIFGFCAGNDVSVRDWQLRTTQVFLGKAFDTHAPFGPWIVTHDALDPADLEISSYVNGQRRQHSRTRHFVFDCAAQVAHLSKVMTLEPGDVIFTGTPAGVGGLMKPPCWLKPGDVVRVEIEGIGWIENRVVDESREQIPVNARV
jgi:2-keto-4-pentenoate hydratase/2-oxohepta-3-ene-1,7-dioic acid hydratase in catechol pathway